MTPFARQLLHWYQREGRKDLPWQQNRTPYRVWVSEIMLQQTQVATVIPYFERFVRSFPDVRALAQAELDRVLEHWAGLGYYSRARNLHMAAKQVCDDFDGEFPADSEQLQSLPGIGRSTAGAILAQAFNQRGVILDGNVKRVLTRYHGIRDRPGSSKVQKQLWGLTDQHTPDRRHADYTQAIMDLGATLCRRKPDCERCPVSDGCTALAEGLTDQIPARKARKPLPVREINMLVLRNRAGEILLERRPPTGIWGGLWSLPECQPDQLEEHLAQLDGEVSIKEIGAIREHQFTHFRLRYQPVEIRWLENHQQVLDSDQSIWYNTRSELNLGLPAPVKKLLNELGEA